VGEREFLCREAEFHERPTGQKMRIFEENFGMFFQWFGISEKT